MLLQSAIALGQKGTRPHRGSVLRAMNLKADILYEQGRPDEAKATLRDLIEHSKSAGLFGCRQALEAMRKLGEYAIREKRFQQAFVYLDHGLATHLFQLGEAHSDTVRIRMSLASAHEGLGQWKESRFHYQRAFETAFSHFPNTTLARECGRLYADFLRKRNEPEEADWIRALMVGPGI